MDAEGKPSCDYEDCDLSDTSRWIILFVDGEKEHENMGDKIIIINHISVMLKILPAAMITSFKNLVMCMPKFFHTGMTALKLFSNSQQWNIIENSFFM